MSTNKDKEKNNLNSSSVNTNEIDPLYETLEVPKLIKEQEAHDKKREERLIQEEKKKATKEIVLETSITQIEKPQQEEDPDYKTIQITKPKEKTSTSQKKSEAKKTSDQQKKTKTKATKPPQDEKPKTKKGGGGGGSKKILIGMSLLVAVGVGSVFVWKVVAPKLAENNKQPSIVQPVEEDQTTEEEISDEPLDEEVNTDEENPLVEEVEEDNIEEDNQEITADEIDETDVIDEADEADETSQESTDEQTTEVSKPSLNDGLTAFGKISQVVGNQIIIQQENTLEVYTAEAKVIESIKEIDHSNEINFIYKEVDGEKQFLGLVETTIEEEVEEKTETSSDGTEEITNEKNPAASNNEASFDDAFSADFEKELEEIRKREVEDELLALEQKEAEAKKEEAVKQTIETLEFPMESKASGPLWFRFAWKTNDVTKTVAKTEDVRLELRTSNGTLITPENADKYGRYWIDKGIINFAIQNGTTGQWTFLATKKVENKLGEIGANVTPLTGFIDIQKFSVKPQEGKLLAIWKIDGVKDDDLLVEIFAEKNGNQTLIYSANSADTALHLIDKAEISTSKLEKGTYDIVLKVTDIDTKKDENGKKTITNKTISDFYTLYNVDLY